MQCCQAWFKHDSGSKSIWRTEVYKYNYPISVVSTVYETATVYFQMYKFTSVGNV